MNARVPAGIGIIFLLVGCTTPNVLISGLDFSGNETNYDRVTILAVDGKRLSAPQREVHVSAGEHFLLLRVSHMRGMFPAPQEADVPLVAAFQANQHYDLNGGIHRGGNLGVDLFTDDRLHYLGGVDVVPPER